MTPAWILLDATAILTLALAGAWLARRARAAVRHLFLSAAFAALLLLPIGSAVAPAVRIEVPAALRTAIVPLDAGAVIEAPQMTTGAGLVARAPEPRPPASTWPSWSTLLMVAWLSGAAVCLMSLLAGLRQVRSLRRGGVPWRAGAALTRTLAREAGLTRRIDVLSHASVAGPMTCGIVHPAILLPIDAETWAEPDLRRAIVHELEHIRRADWLTQCLARVVLAGYWCHPIAWMGWRRLVLEAERACDDAVLRDPASGLESGIDATAYADQLVLLAQRLSAAASHPQIAMANRRDLSARVRAVLDTRQRRGRAGVAWIGIATCACALLVTTIAPLRIVAASAAGAATARQGGSAWTPASEGGSDRTQTSEGASAQTSSKPKYEVASIKPCPPEPGATDTGGRGRGAAGGTNAAISPGRFTVPCVTVEQLIYLAYASYGAGPDELLANDYLGTASDATKVRGGPAWVHSAREKYMIEATAPAAVSDRITLMGAMLQTLLEDRFQLKIHRDTEKVPMYALRLAKGGLKITPMKDGDCDANASVPPSPAAMPRCGYVTHGRSGSDSQWHYVGFKLGFLARELSDPLHGHVIDETGVPGTFVISLTFSVDDAAARQPDAVPATAPPIFKALEEQLGLKLETVQAPRGFIVIDHIERPTPDAPEPARLRQGDGGPARARGAGTR